MAKFVKNKLLLKAIGKAFNIKKKHIELKKTANGSFQLNIKNLTAESLDAFALSKRSEFTDIKLKPEFTNTTVIEQNNIIEDNASSKDHIPDVHELSIGTENSDKVDLEIPTTTKVEEITLPKSFEDIPLPCNCINCELNSTYKLFQKAQADFKNYLKQQPIPKRKGPNDKPVNRKRRGLRANRKFHARTILTIGNNLANLIPTQRGNIALPHPSSPNLQLTAKAMIVRYSTKNNKRVEFTIPSACLENKLDLESDLSVVADETLPPVSSNEVELYKTDNLIEPIMNALPPKANASTCECIYCVIYPIVLKLRSNDRQSKILQDKIKSLQAKKPKVLKFKRAEISRSIAKLQKQKNVILKSSNKFKNDISKKLSCYGDIAHPHPTRISINLLQKANMISYLSKDEIRVQLTLVKKCDSV